MIVRKIGNVTVYDDFKFSDSMNRVENLRIDLKTDIYQSVDICCNVYWNQFFYHDIHGWICT